MNFWLDYEVQNYAAESMSLLEPDDVELNIPSEVFHSLGVKRVEV